jgi:hypothetical protein
LTGNVLKPTRTEAGRAPVAERGDLQMPQTGYVLCRILVIAALTSAALLVFVGDITAASRAVYAPLSKIAVPNQPDVRASRH